MQIKKLQQNMEVQWGINKIPNFWLIEIEKGDNCQASGIDQISEVLIAICNLMTNNFNMYEAIVVVWM